MAERPKVTREQIREVVRKTLRDLGDFNEDLIGAVYRVRCKGADVAVEAQRLADRWMDDGNIAIPCAWDAIVDAGIVNFAGARNISIDGMEKFWQVDAFIELLPPTFESQIREATKRSEPTRSHFSIELTNDGCNVLDRSGNVLLCCTRQQDAMIVHTYSPSATGAMKLLGRTRFTSHHHLLETVVSAFLCLPSAYLSFKKYPTTKAPFQPVPGRVYLCVPYEERHAAQSAGAAYDGNEKAWYISSDLLDSSAFARWRPHFDIRPAPLPQTAWFSNLRSELSPEDWSILKKKAKAESGARCEACGGRGEQWPVECHEIWDFDDASGVQTLLGMTAICPPCHEVVHIGLANMNGRSEEAIRHMAKVTGQSYNECVDVANSALQQALGRSRRKWRLDISFLDKLGMKYRNPSEVLAASAPEGAGVTSYR